MVQSVSVVAGKAGQENIVEPGATWPSAHLSWIALPHPLPDRAPHLCRPIPWGSRCSSPPANLCVGGWVAAKERSGLAYVVTFVLLLPVREFVPFLCAIDTFLTPPGRPVSRFYRPRQDLGDHHFSILVLPLHPHWAWPFPGTSAVLDTRPVLQEINSRHRAWSLLYNLIPK